MKTSTTTKICVTVLVMSLVATRTAAAQKPLIDDDRTYSARSDDRSYVAARCAALYLRLSESMRMTDSARATQLGVQSLQLAHSAPPAPVRVLVQWHSTYGAMIARREAPQASMWGQDYQACSGLLTLVEHGETVAKYTREELRFLMGVRP